MTFSLEDLYSRLRRTGYCRPEVAETAAAFAGVSTPAYAELAQRLLKAGEGKTLGILLRVSALNQVKLAPGFLVEAYNAVDDFHDCVAAFALAGPEAIPPLLELIEAEDAPDERRSFAARLATELVITHGIDPLPLKKTLQKHAHAFHLSPQRAFFTHNLSLLVGSEEKRNHLLWFSRIDALADLPEKKPPVIIGGDFSVRRPVPKTGRNDPCHCGSGKKYKKCCYEKDQELLRDASPYAGVTLTQLKTEPTVVRDVSVIHNLPAQQLRKLKPQSLNDEQLFAAYRSAEFSGMVDLAFEMLLALKNRPGKEEMAVGHFADLINSAFRAARLDLVDKIIEVVPVDKFSTDQSIAWKLNVLAQTERFASLEAQCRKAVRDKHGLALVGLSHDLEPFYPAMSLIFARAAIASQSELFLENEVLMDLIVRTRLALDLEAEGDPITTFHDWSMNKVDFDMQHRSLNEETQLLKREVIEARQVAAQKVRELRQKESELQALMQQIEAAQKKPAESLTQTSEPVSKEVTETIEHLRRRLKNLKEEIKAQQQVRADLRQQLEEVRKKSPAAPQSAPAPVATEGDDADESKDFPKKIILPEYTETFRRSIENFPAPLVAKALRLATGFALNDKEVWHHTKSLENLPELYRIRVGIHHRLMLRWRPGVSLQILDLIQRRDLEAWIKHYVG